MLDKKATTRLTRNSLASALAVALIVSAPASANSSRITIPYPAGSAHRDVTVDPATCSPSDGFDLRGALNELKQRSRETHGRIVAKKAMLEDLASLHFDSAFWAARRMFGELLAPTSFVEIDENALSYEEQFLLRKLSEESLPTRVAYLDVLPLRQIHSFAVELIDVHRKLYDSVTNQFTDEPESDFRIDPFGARDFSFMKSEIKQARVQLWLLEEEARLIAYFAQKIAVMADCAEVLVQESPFSWSIGCKWGGIRSDSGFDIDRDGMLDSSEILDSRESCRPDVPEGVSPQAFW